MDAKQKLEEVIRDYMLDFKLPDSPTVYDYLIMGLFIPVTPCHEARFSHCRLDYDPFVLRNV